MLTTGDTLRSDAVLTAPEVASAAALATFPWAYETRSFAALGHHFRIRTSTRAVGEHLEEVFAAFPHADQSDGQLMTYSLIDEAQAIRPYAMYADTERLTLANRPAWVLRCLVWHLNQQVIHRDNGYVLVHAGAVSSNGVGVLLPGSMEAGKTTLTAGLLRAGCRYLTDEAAALDPSDLTVVAYPKPLSVDVGSWDVLTDLKPPVDDVLAAYHAEQWQVSALTIRADIVSAPTPPALIVQPRYVKGSKTRVEQVSRAEMLGHLMDNTFRVRSAGRHKFEVLGALAAQTTCYRLTVGDLDTSCALVLGLADAHRSDRTQQ